MSDILNPVIIGLGSPVIDFVADENEANNAAARHLVANGYVADDKNYPDPEEYAHIHDLAEAYGVTGTQVHGGSAANKMCTLHRILVACGRKPLSYYIAAIDRSSPAGRESVAELENAGLKVLPDNMPGAELATSINFSFPREDGKTGKLPFIGAGNAKELMDVPTILKAIESIRDEIPLESDRFLTVESSQFRKFHPEVIEEHIRRARAMGCKLVVALETSTKDVEKNREALLALVQQAEIVTGNEKELMALFPPRNQPGIKPLEDSIAQLRDVMREGNGQEFFITQGGEDIIIGGSHTTPQHIAIMPVEQSAIRSYTGGGDCATAAYLAYRMMGYSSKRSAQIASVYGGKNIQLVETRMPNEMIQELAHTAERLYPRQQRTVGAA